MAHVDQAHMGEGMEEESIVQGGGNVGCSGAIIRL